MDIVTSRNGVPIRFPEERWFHITEGHSELAGYYFEILETISTPQVIYEGNEGAAIALREVESGKFLVVVYRELTENDGFIVTAFLTRRPMQFERRTRVWPR